MDAVDDVVARSGSSLRDLVAAGNDAKLSQGQMLDAANRLLVATGRASGSTVDVANGGKLMLPVTGGSAQPVLHVAADGVARLGHASITYRSGAKGELIRTVSDVVIP